jgi:hypothetical protein
MLVRGGIKSSGLVVGTRANVSKNLAYSNHPIDGLAQFYDHIWPSERAENHPNDWLAAKSGSMEKLW